MCAAGALRGAPASTTRTLRRALDSTSAADRPAAPPPMTTTSYSLIAAKAAARCGCPPKDVAVPGKQESDGTVDDTSAADIAAVLDQVGARLKRIRLRRRMT